MYIYGKKYLPNQVQSHGFLAWPWPGAHSGQATGHYEATILAWPGPAYFWPAGLRPGRNNTNRDTRNGVEMGQECIVRVETFVADDKG